MTTPAPKPPTLAERLKWHYGVDTSVCAEVAALEAENASLGERVAGLEAVKDGAYHERNMVVTGLASLAVAAGYKTGVARTAIEGWSEDWQGCVFIDLPTGQVSWHYHDSEAELFAHLPAYDGDWDGHSTSEKYERVLSLRARLSGDTR